MPGESKNTMQCAEFDVLLSDALDGKLSGLKLESFKAHAGVCEVCGPLLMEADAGQRWLKALDEVEPPADMVRNIVLATSGIRPTWWERFTSYVVAPVANIVRQPRFAMSFGMAFFSLSVTLSLAGVRMSDLRHVDLRPSAIKRTYYQTNAKVVKYYQNIRLVYEVQLLVRDFKRATPPPDQKQEDKNKNQNQKNDTSGQPDQQEQRNYSQDENQPVLASVPDFPPVVPVTTYRRLV